MRLLSCLVLALLAACSYRAAAPRDELRSARALLRSENFAPALAQVEQGLRQAQRAGDPKRQWEFRLLEAEILIAERDPKATLSALREMPPDGPHWAESRGRALLLRARAESLLSHDETADGLVSAAEREGVEAGSAALSAEIALRRGALRAHQGRFAEAEGDLRRAIDQAAALHDPYLAASATGNLGAALLAESRYDEAIPWFEKARAAFLRLGANDSVARAAGNLGSCYFRLGDFDRAREQYQQAEEEFAKTGNRFEEQAWMGNAGNVLYAEGDYSSAASAYLRALDLARQVSADTWVSRWLSNLAITSIQLQEWDAAEHYNHQAEELKQRIPGARSEIYSLYNTARIAEGRKQLAQAEELYRRALLQPADDPTVVLDTHAGLAELYVKTGRQAQAEAQFQAAVAAIDRLSSSLLKDDYRFSYRDSLIRFYRGYVDFLMAAGQPERALEVAESSRARVLEQQSGRSERLRAGSAAEYRELSRRMNAVILEYWFGESQSYLWTITRQRIRNYHLPADREIRPLVASYRAVTMAARDPLEAAAGTGEKLYQMLLAPAASDLCGRCRVVLVPDAGLYSLNLESLPAGPDTRHYWIEQANVEVAPSLNYLIERSRGPRPRRGTGLLVLGDPTPSLAEYPKLEFAAREMEDIGSAMKGSPETILRGEQARPSAYTGAQPGRFGLIHFSAHASANPQSPLDSAVILSGPPDRCKLFARDVMSVPLRAELVTISACRSAGAKTYAGEGPVGLAWAFLRAGARHVIAGLWDVDDRSTAQLMSRLYAELARGSTPGEALRAAKLGLIQAGGAYAKPFYWAPFQLYAGAP